MSPQFPGPDSADAHRWSIGRVATDLAVVAVAVPCGLGWLAPATRGECATTLDAFAMALGLGFLGARLAWLPLRALNDATERWLTDREKRARPSNELPGPHSTP